MTIFLFLKIYVLHQLPERFNVPVKMVVCAQSMALKNVCVPRVTMDDFVNLFNVNKLFYMIKFRFLYSDTFIDLQKRINATIFVV